MKDEKANDQRVRLNLEILPTVKEQLDGLQTRTGAGSMVEVIRRALALYDLVTEHCEANGQVVLKHATGKTETLRIL